MSQGLNIDNAVKSWWVVMSTSFSNDGPHAGGLYSQQMNAQAVPGQHNRAWNVEAFQG